MTWLFQNMSERSAPAGAKFRAGAKLGLPTANMENCELIKSGRNFCQHPEHQASGAPPQ